jgi:hypothetical protein
MREINFKLSDFQYKNIKEKGGMYLKQIVKRTRNRLTMIVSPGMIILLSSIMLSACVSKGNEQVSPNLPIAKAKNTPVNDTHGTNWITYSDPHGFSLLIPKDWRVEVHEGGIITISRTSDNIKGPTAFMWTLVSDKTTDNSQILKELIPELSSLFPELEIISQRQIDKYNILACKIKCGDNYSGALTIGLSNNNVLVSGVLDVGDNFAENRTDLLKILSSFKYDNSIMDSSKFDNLIQLIPWKDPNEGAFTINVPKGWDVKGGVIRPYIDATYTIKAESAEMGIEYYNPYPPIYTVPNPVLSFSGFGEGSHYNPSGGIAQDMIVMREKTAEEYIRQIWAKKLNLTVTEVKDRPDLIKNIPHSQLVKNITSFEATLTGDGKAHKVFVIEHGIGIDATVLWTVSLTHYWSTEAKLNTMDKVYNAMSKSFKLDVQWVTREQTEVAKRSGIISSTAEGIDNIINSTFQSNSDVKDRAMHNYSNAILGVEDVYNPDTGESYQVPSGSNHYWTDSYNIIGTQTDVPPTYQDDWTELLSEGN